MAKQQYVIRHGRRVAIKTLNPTPAKPKRKKAEPFTMIAHTDAAKGFAALGCLAALVWYGLLHREWAERRRTVRLPTALLRSWGVDRWAWGRALVHLERAGLITVERRPGCAPEVTLLRR